MGFKFRELRYRRREHDDWLQRLQWLQRFIRVKRKWDERIIVQWLLERIRGQLRRRG